MPLIFFKLLSEHVTAYDLNIQNAKMLCLSLINILIFAEDIQDIEDITLITLKI